MKAVCSCGGFNSILQFSTGLIRRLFVYDQKEIKKTNWFTYVRAGEKGLAELTVICKKLHHFFSGVFLSFILSFFLT